MNGHQVRFNSASSRKVSTAHMDMSPRLFIGTLLVGYDYMLFTSMLGVFLISGLITYILRKG